MQAQGQVHGGLMTNWIFLHIKRHPTGFAVGFFLGSILTAAAFIVTYTLV